MTEPSAANDGAGSGSGGKGGCPKCGFEMKCKYNHFEQDGLTIDAWEVKCANCGYRNTRAFRSDDADLDFSTFNPTLCPSCGRSGPEVKVAPCRPS